VTGYKTRQDKTRQDKTRQDKTRQDKTRQDKDKDKDNDKDKDKGKDKDKTMTRQDKIRQGKCSSSCFVLGGGGNNWFFFSCLGSTGISYQKYLFFLLRPFFSFVVDPFTCFPSGLSFIFDDVGIAFLPSFRISVGPDLFTIYEFHK
jgi:hypothetical protein